MSRIEALKTLQKRGFKVAIRVEPLLLIPHFKEVYGQFFETLATHIDPRDIENVFFGMFKIPKDFLKKMQKMYPQSPLFHTPLEIGEGGEYTYPDDLKHQMVDFVYERLTEIFGREKVFSHLVAGR